MDIAFALDWDRDSQHTFQINFPDAIFKLEDIREISTSYVRTLVDAQRPNPILFCGCAPCQPFTKQNTTRRPQEADDRLSLLSYFATLVEQCGPDIVFVENVPGLHRFDHGSQTFGGFLQRLKLAGYSYDYKLVPLKRYGIPQNRSRLVLLAMAGRYGQIKLPPETNGPNAANPRYQTVRDWIGDFPPIVAGAEHPDIPNHRAAKLSAKNLHRVRATPEGGGHASWPKELQLPCHKKTPGYSDVYGRMSWDLPASGLTTRCISYSNGRFGHPEQDRAISVREAASLQTFPLDFRFKGSLTSMARQIGNAVPVHLAKIMGLHVIEHLQAVGALK